jgi:hypothetical protein
MSSVHEQHEAHHYGAGHYGARTLPATLGSPEVLKAWRTRALIVFAVAALLSVPFFFTDALGPKHVLRAYLLGFMISFSLAGGGLAMLMLQYVSGGKWGMLLRRPLEAMSRTMLFVSVLFIPVGIFAKYLYQWALYPTIGAERQALAQGLVTKEQAWTAISKYTMFNPTSATIQTVLVFSILIMIAFFLNKWSLERDADPARGTVASYDKWRVRFENLSGPGIFIYVVCLTDAALLWIMSLDVTWYSSIWGLQFLVGQGFIVLAVGILTVVKLSKVEPMKTLLRVTEQHDLGKFAFAFVMLNIYLTFAEFLIIWSGNVPDEIPWYLSRIRGGWWYICTADFICHWVIPFCMLLSRNLKRDKKRLTALAMFMIFARCLDMFWLIEPNFKDAAGNLHILGNFSILAYVTVPLAVLSLWASRYFHELMQRPLVNVNDPHLEEMLEPDHAH